MLSSADIVRNAYSAGTAIPAFNVPHLPMVEPVIRAVVDQDSVALIEVARLEWTKFEAHSPRAVRDEFTKWFQPDHVRLHLDHIPVIDEDNLRVDYLSIIEDAIELGFHSVMIDGSRLPLAENIEATRAVVEVAHAAGIPCEAELGAVLGHEAEALPPYDELFESGRGFTRVDETARFVQETGCDWLSVAIGNIHGAVSGVLKDQRKVQARLHFEHLGKLSAVAKIPLVLHGGSGITREHVLAAFTRGIAKINIGSEIRQTYEKALRETCEVAAAQEAVYERTCWLIRDYLELAGTRPTVNAAPT